MRKKSQRAARFAEHAIDLLRKHEHVAELGLAHRELGLALFDLEPDRAEKNLTQAIDLYERAGSKLRVALTYRYLGELREAGGGDGCPDFRSAARTLPHDF